MLLSAAGGVSLWTQYFTFKVLLMGLPLHFLYKRTEEAQLGFWPIH